MSSNKNTKQEKIILEPKKGISGYIVKEKRIDNEIEEYIVIEYDKRRTPDDDDEIREHKHTVHINEVNRARQALKEIEETNFKEEKIPAPITWATIRIHINHFNAPSWSLLWGKNRKVYFTYYYYPLKVLEHLKEIEYTKRGYIIKQKDSPNK